MIGVLAALALLAVLSWGFWATVRRFSPVEISFWHALAVLFAASHVTRFAIGAFTNLDVPTKLGVSFLVYVIVLTGDLVVLAKISVVRAAAIATAYAVVATIASFIVLAVFFPGLTAKGSP